jgi:hypothetical protein
MNMIRRHIILCAAAVMALAFDAPPRAQERITLSAPETVPQNTTYRVVAIDLREDDPDTLVLDEAAIRITLMGVQQRTLVHCNYTSSTTPTGATLLVGLNKANLSSAYAGNGTTGSLKQRLFHRLVVMNEAPAACGRSLAGSLSGSPQ